MLTLTIITGCFTTTFAYTYSSGFDLSYQVFNNGRGCVNGEKNKIYYNLSNKPTALNVTSKGGSWTITVELTRGAIIAGRVYCSGSSGFYSFGKVPAGKYHLFASGGNANSFMSLTGQVVQY